MMTDLPFYFAWAGPNELFDPHVHAVKDEDVLKFDVDQSEGDFASMTIEVRNPRVGLLAPARKVWAWLSIQSESAIEPLFYGRLVGVPADINKETVTMQFTARPYNFAVLKAALAASLKVLPYYDPIFINPSQLDDPDVVLEAYSALWSIDRVTHAVQISDILVGEDGAEEFFENEVPYDSVAIKLGQTPLRSVSMDACVNWTQQFEGTLPAVGSNVPIFRGMGISSSVETYTGASLIGDWPKVGASFGGGWTCIEASAVDMNEVEKVQNVSWDYNYQNTQKEHLQGDTMSMQESGSKPLLRGPAIYSKITEKIQPSQLDPGDALTDTFGDSDPINIPAHSEHTGIFVPLWNVVLNLTLGYEASRPRKEHVLFTLKTNVQPIVTLPEEADTLSIKLDSVDIGLPIIGTTEVPIVDLKRRTYFPTDRGLLSLEYLIMLARAHLLIRSRTVEVTYACTFERAIALSQRMNGILHDPRLPGHQAVGKIINYKFGIDASTGKKIGSVTIGCAIGYGQAVNGSAGNPTYVDDDYVEEGYQTYINQIVVVQAGDVTYVIPIDTLYDDGLRFPLSMDQVKVAAGLIGTKENQEAVIDASFAADKIVAGDQPITIEQQNAFQAAQQNVTQEALKLAPISWFLELKPVNAGPFEGFYDLTLSQLEVPRQIDLEAAA